MPQGPLQRRGGAPTTSSIVSKFEEGHKSEAVNYEGDCQDQEPRQEQFGRVYVASADDADQDSEIITSTLLI